MAHHELKIVAPYFYDVLDGIKTFEIRKNDRKYNLGDTLDLREYNQFGKFYTGRRCAVNVTYITTFAQRKGWCVLGINNPKPTPRLTTESPDHDQ